MDDPAVGVNGFEFDAFNRAHLLKRGVDEATVHAIWYDEPVIIANRAGKTGTHLMIGEDLDGLLWTIVLVPTDRVAGIWRPITGFPTEREDEVEAWRQGS
ncbi:MAG TPA: hypothetical protein VNM91_09355 [Dehalococcoidia bacterium]|nr:hypothetical protein [Dehalococcoidia bacterium]